MQAKTLITDEELAKLLEESFLDYDQKLHIMPLIPVMEEGQRTELLDLINEANTLEEKRNESEKKYNEGLRELNKEYESKMDQIVKEETSHAIKGFEKISHDKDYAELEDLEKEINNI